MANVYAVVVGIQSYQQKNIKGVAYAHDDARAIAAALHERLNVPQGNIKLWIDHNATYARLQNELKHDIMNLSPDDKFYFFYAGHGFWAPAGGNRLTVWDTHMSNTVGTTVSMEDVLFRPLRQSRCRQSVIFIDACSTEIFEDAPDSRDIISEMDQREFSDFVKNTRYAAAFFACSPEEKSYSSPSLKHGVWTYHLIRALRGEESEAVFNEKFVTGQSLQDYLLEAVRKFIRKNFATLSAVQTPFARIDQNGTFIIAELPEPEPASGGPLLSVSFDTGTFVGRTSKPFRYFDGYGGRNTPPSKTSISASNWAKRLCEEQVASELQAVATKARTILKLKSKQIDKDEDLATGSVDTDHFRYEVTGDQNPDIPDEVLVQRELSLRKWKLPPDFDEIFEEKIDTLILSTPGSRGQYVDLLDAIEEYEIGTDTTSEGDQTKETIHVTTAAGSKVFFDTKNETLVLNPINATDCSSILAGLDEDFFNFLIGPPPQLTP